MERLRGDNLISSLAYDPSKTTIAFDGIRVMGSASDRKYVRVSPDHHELHLQVGSEFLQKVGVGMEGVLTINAHAGGDRYVSVNCGILRVGEIYIKELSRGVPEVVVVLKKV